MNRFFSGRDNNDVESDGENNGRKRSTTFATPGGKGKQFRTEDTGGRDESSPATTRTEVLSPEDSPMAEGTNDAETPSTDEENKELTTYWKNLVERDEGAREAPNLAFFLGAKEKREAATEQFSMALDECMAGLEGSVQETLQDSVVPFHEEQRVRMEDLDEDIISTMTENHKKRKSMQDRLEKANAVWTKTFHRLMAEALGKELEPTHRMNANEEDDTSTIAPPAKDGEGSKDPDWNALSEFPPTAENIRCFLATRDRLQAAEEALSQAMDEIMDGLKADVEEMIQVGFDFHNQNEANYSALEEDIQFHLMSNHKRGREYQEKLEETKRSIQGMFASLFARVTRT